MVLNVKIELTCKHCGPKKVVFKGDYVNRIIGNNVPAYVIIFGMTIHMQRIPRQRIIYDRYYQDACHMIHHCCPLSDCHKHTSCHRLQHHHHHHHDHDYARINPSSPLQYIYKPLGKRFNCFTTSKWVDHKTKQYQS